MKADTYQTRTAGAVLLGPRARRGRRAARAPQPQDHRNPYGNSIARHSHGNAISRPSWPAAHHSAFKLHANCPTRIHLPCEAGVPTGPAALTSRQMLNFCLGT